MVLEWVRKRSWLGKRAFTDVVAHVSCYDHGIMSGDTYVDGSVFVEAKIRESREQGCSRRWCKWWSTPWHRPVIRVHAFQNRSALLQIVRSASTIKCTMLNPGVLSG